MGRRLGVVAAWRRTAGPGVGQAGGGPGEICEIDVGLTGAVAIVDGQDVLFVDDMPVHQVASGKKLRAEVDLAALREMLCTRPVDHVMLEQVAARPGQGTVSMFRFGYSAGAVAGIVAALQLPRAFLLPRAWQKAVGVGPSPDAARQRAAQL